MSSKTNDTTKQTIAEKLAQAIATIQAAHDAKVKRGKKTNG